MAQSPAQTPVCCEPNRLNPDEARRELDALSTPDLLNRYARGIENFDRRVVRLRDDQLDTAFLPDAGVGRWPARVLLGHLADAELVFAHRMRRAVAEDNPVLAVWDENAFVDSGLYAGPKAPIGAFLAAIHTTRRWTVEWLASLTPEQLARTAMHPERGSLTVRDTLVYSTWHLEHHGRYLNAKIERFLGPAPAEETPTGGCGPGCGCAGKAKG